MNSLSKFNRLVVFDYETSGLKYNKDKVIEYGIIEFIDGNMTNQWEGLVNHNIEIDNSNIHGITKEMCAAEGITPDAFKAIMKTVFIEDPNTLYIAYNLNFDISFLLEILGNHKMKFNVLDPLSIHRDRNQFDGDLDDNNRKYGHRLEGLVKKYNIDVKNNHRALQDVIVTVMGLQALGKENDNLLQYVNRIGYNSKYGVSGIKLEGVTYIGQSLYGNREIENYTQEKKDYSGPKEYVLETTDEEGNKRYFCSDSRIEGLNRPITFSKTIVKMLSKEEAVDLAKFVKKEYGASGNKAKKYRADHLFIMKVKFER